jgi:hypothetical protein
MLLAAIFTVAAYLVYYRFPAIGVLCTAIAVGCFIGAYVIAFRGPQNLGRERRWRGQLVDYGDSSPGDLGPTLRRWWGRLTRRQ